MKTNASAGSQGTTATDGQLGWSRMAVGAAATGARGVPNDTKTEGIRRDNGGGARKKSSAREDETRRDAQGSLPASGSRRAQSRARRQGQHPEEGSCEPATTGPVRSTRIHEQVFAGCAVSEFVLGQAPEQVEPRRRFVLTTPDGITAERQAGPYVREPTGRRLGLTSLIRFLCEPAGWRYAS